MKNLTRTTITSLATLTALTLGAWATCDADVDMGEHNIINVADPINDQDVATKAYVDAEIAKINPAPTDRFTRNDDKFIVTDHTTGLMWQDNADVADNTKQLPWLTQADYNECETAVDNHEDDPAICKNTPPKDETAQKYCFDLELGGLTDWRLPTKKELEGIVKEGVGSPTISGVFQHIDSSFSLYWSSTYYSSKEAWIIQFSDGHLTSGNREHEAVHVRCVRDGQ